MFVDFALVIDMLALPAVSVAMAEWFYFLSFLDLFLSFNFLNLVQKFVNR